MTAAPPETPAEAPPLWWILASGTVWGPYPPSRMRTFLAEGRLSPRTRASAAPGGPFRPAAELSGLQELFTAPEASGPSLPQTDRPPPDGDGDTDVERSADGDGTAPTLASSRPLAGDAEPVAMSGAEGLPEGPQSGRGRGSESGLTTGGPAALRSLLVYAEPASDERDWLAATLSESGGQAVPMASGLWLVRSALSASGLRNRLTRGLGQEDRLLVVEAPLEAAAWFNLRLDERGLRALWAGEGAYARGASPER